MWPCVITCVSGPLSFATSQSNLRLFQYNYTKTKLFTEQVNGNQDLLLLFNWQTYGNLVIIEMQDRLVKDLEQHFEQPLAGITVAVCLEVLQDLYLPECGPRFIKLVV